MKAMTSKAKSIGFKLFASLLVVWIVSVGIPGIQAAAQTMGWSGLADGDILIKDTITPITTGVVEHEVITNVPSGDQQKIDYICEITPSDSIEVVAGYGKNDASSWRLTSTTAQAAAYEQDNPGKTVVAAVNADFFNMATGEPMGALVMDGKVCHNSNGRNYFGITKDGQAVIRSSSDLSDLQMAVGGDVILVQDGKAVEENGAYGALQYSRCAIGIKADGTIVTFVTYGLRAPISCGRTYNEIAHMMANAGCVSALALDGGGSATYCSRPEGSDKLVVSNSPSDGAEREVSSSILIVSTAEATGVFDHAALTPNNEVYTPGSTVQFEAKGVDTAGMPVDVPANTTWSLSDKSLGMGSIDADTGVFTANEEQGTVTVELQLDGVVIGSTSIDIAVPDHIYFASEEVSLGFEDETDFGIVVRNQGRDVHYKDGDLIWTTTNEAMGTFNGNIFVSSDGESLNGDVTATSRWDEDVSGTIHVIVGMLPTIVWDFEDYTDPETGNIIDAQEYYIGSEQTAGILTHSNYGRGGKESIEIVGIDNDEPVRFGSKSLKLNYDFINCGEVTEGACIGTTERMQIPGVPTAIGVWVYAPEGVGIEWQGDGTTSGFWLRGYVRDGNGSNQPYDFTLEPKNEKVQNGEVLPGIYWEGWMYLEADLTHLASPYSIQPGMTFRLMYVAGTGMGTKSAGSIYFDNLQFVYGTNVDDIDAPVIDSITVNDTELEDGAVLDTDTLNITALFHDVQNKYTSGIDVSTVRMYVDGINVVNNENYQYVLEPDGTINHLYDLKLQDGSHTITVSLRDGFGNEVAETRNFSIQTGSAADTTVEVVPVEDTAVIGKTVTLEIRASNNTVAESAVTLKLGNLFPDYEVSFSDNFEGETSYSKLTGQISISAVRKTDASAEDGNLIATVAVKIPTTLNQSASFTYTVKGGCFTTSEGFYTSFSAPEASLPVGAAYTISSKSIIVSDQSAVIEVKTQDGAPAPGVTIYLAEDDSVIGTTDENGQLITDYFSKTAGKYMVYAKDADGLLSFLYTVTSYNAAGSEDGLPYNVRFNATFESATQKNISWLSNPLTEGEQSIQYAVSGTEQWVALPADSELFTFTANGNMSVVVNNIVLDGLTPSTSYDFRVGAEDAWTEIKTFTTDSASKLNTKFFLLGDIQADDLTNITAVTDILRSGGYDFGIQTGDAVDDATSYFDWLDVTGIFNAGTFGDVDLIQVLGNHEYSGDANGRTAEAMYNLPTGQGGGHYSMTYGNVYVAVINYTSTVRQLTDALAWLEADAQSSNADWKVLVMHQPPYYTNLTGGNAEIYNYVPDAVEAAGIDVVFSGHDHSLTRTNQLKDDMINTEDGILYYICGSSGEKSYSITSQSKFDYDTIFALATLDFTATYLSVESSQDQLTINVYDLNRGLMDTYTLQSECIRKGHSEVFNPENDTVTCAVCGNSIEGFTGEIFDKDENEYYLMAGVKQTDWVTLGEEIRFYNPETGIKEELTKEETPSTCIIDGYCIYTSESGAVKRVEYNDAGGHEYEEQEDGSFVCSACGHTRIDMDTCTVTLSYDACTYTGNARTPATKAVAPDGTVLTKTGSYRDYYSTYKNNVEVGTASVTLTACKYGVYVNMNDWRGNCRGTVTVNYEIRPDLPKDVKIVSDSEGTTLTWTNAMAADTYVIYKSEDGINWTELDTTSENSYALSAQNSEGCAFKIGTRKTVDGKTYESLSLTREVYTGPVVTAGISENDGKPTLKWNRIVGAQNYEVYRATSENGTYTKVFTTDYITYTHVSAKVDTTYYYKVRAVYADGSTSLFSKVVQNTCVCGPTQLSVSSDDEGLPVLAWETVSGAKEYAVYRADSQEDTYAKIATATAVTYTDKSAKSGETYSYKVCAVSNSGNNGLFSNVESGTCLKVRPEPVASNRPVDGKPTLKWEPIEGAVSYQVYRANQEDGSYVCVFTTTGTSYTHVSAQIGQTYYYKVKAIWNDGQYKFSDIVSCSCVGSDFSVTCSNRSVDGKPVLSWTAVSEADSYQVYRSTALDGKYVRVYTTTGTTYTHISAEENNAYYYKVKVVYPNGDSTFSEIVRGVCQENKFVPETLHRIVDGKPVLKWEKDSSVVQYQVYRSNSENGNFVRVFTTTGNSYTHVSAVVDGKYYYKVKAVLSNGTGVFSEVVVNDGICGQPVVTVGNRESDGKPTLKWEEVPEAKEYEVYRSTKEKTGFVKVFTTTGKTYTHVSASEDTTYYYKVRAVSEKDVGGMFSKVVSGSIS